MRKYLLAFTLVCGLSAHAQDDPTIMVINGQPIARSEFEYSYNKNNADGVIDKKTVDEYVDLFVNYKLKVAAALDARYDTLSSFKKEFASYRDQQVRPSIITDQDVLEEAHNIYNRTKESIGAKGLIRPAHIFLRLMQKSTSSDQEKVKNRIDSIYRALQQGANFEELAKRLSQDGGTAANGGVLPWIGPNQTLKEFEDAAYNLKIGEMSKPVLSPAGYHIILLKEKKQLEPFDTLKNSILQFIEARGLREQIIDHKLEEMVKNAGESTTKEQILEKRALEMQKKDADLKNLIREYHDGLLLYEISNKTVWDKAAKDEAGLAKFFAKNKKKYSWNEPRFKGIAYHVKNAADVEAVKKSIKKAPFDQWTNILRTTFNNDSVIRIRVEKGIFKRGDNALIDRDIFKKDTVVTTVKDYPIDATFGKVLKKGPEDYTDVRGLVTADYQDALEHEWVADLRKKYSVTINKDILKTVNKHN